MSRKNICSLVFLIVLMLTFVFTLCSCTNKLEGKWVCDNAPDNYPGIMILKSDGTGSADGYSMNWATSGDILDLKVALAGSFCYEYELDGSTLYLDGYGYHK